MPPVVSVTAPRGARAEERSFEQLAQLAPSVVMITVHDYSGEAFAGGSGIMIGSKGYILTNNHVLEDGSFFRFESKMMNRLTEPKRLLNIIRCLTWQ